MADSQEPVAENSSFSHVVVLADALYAAVEHAFSQHVTVLADALYAAVVHAFSQHVAATPGAGPALVTVEDDGAGVLAVAAFPFYHG